LSHGDVGAMGAINFTLHRHDRDIFMTSKSIKISLCCWTMLIVPETATVMRRGGVV